MWPTNGEAYHTSKSNHAKYVRVNDAYITVLTIPFHIAAYSITLLGLTLFAK